MIYLNLKSILKISNKLNLTNTFCYNEDKHKLDHFKTLFSSNTLEILEEIIIDQEFLSIDDSLFQSLNRDCLHSLKYIELPRLFKNPDISFCVDITDEDEYDSSVYPTFKINDYFTPLFGPRTLGIGKYDYSKVIQSFQSISLDYSNPVYNLERFTLHSEVDNKVSLKIFNKDLFKNLKCLEFTGKNIVTDIESVALSDEYYLKSLEKLFIQLDCSNEQFTSECLLNKNFSKLQCLSLSFKSRIKFNFTEFEAEKYEMNLKCLELVNVELEDKATAYFHIAFKYLEVLSLDNCKVYEISGGSMILDLQKLKAISISNMNDNILYPLLNEEHKLYSSDESIKLRSRIEGLSINKISSSTKSLTTSTATNIKSKVVSKQPIKPIKASNKPKTDTKEIASINRINYKTFKTFAQFKNLKALRFTQINLDYDKVKFNKLELLELLECKIENKDMIENTLSNFPNLKHLRISQCVIKLQNSGGKPFVLPNLETLSFDNEFFLSLLVSSRAVESSKPGKVIKKVKESKEDLTHKIYSLMFQGMKSLTKLQSIMVVQRDETKVITVICEETPTRFNSQKDREEYAGSWGNFYSIPGIRKIDHLQLFSPLMKEMIESNHTPLVKNEMISFWDDDENTVRSRLFGNQWMEYYYKY